MHISIDLSSLGVSSRSELSKGDAFYYEHKLFGVEVDLLLVVTSVKDIDVDFSVYLDTVFLCSCVGT